MTTSTDDQLRSHLRTLATTPTRSAEEVEQDVLHRVARRRRRRRHGVVLGGTAVLALLAAVTVLVADGGDSDTGTDVKAFEKERAASSPGKAAVDQLVNMVEIQRFYPDPTERVTIEFDAPLPDDAVTQVDDIADVDVSGMAVVVQDTSAWTVCGTRHWDVSSPRAHVNILFPASWFEAPENAANTPVRFPGYEYDPPVGLPGYEDVGASQQGPKTGACGPYKGYVHVAIWGAQSDDVEISVTADRTRVVVDIGPL